MTGAASSLGEFPAQSGSAEQPRLPSPRWVFLALLFGCIFCAAGATILPPLWACSAIILVFALLFWLTARHHRALEREFVRQMKAQEKYLTAVFDGSADAIIGLDQEEVVQWWNKGAEMLFGYTSQEMIGRKFHVIVPPELLAAGEIERLAEAVRRDGFIRNYETERIAKDGRRLTVSLTRTLLRDERGRILGTSAIVRDITQEKLMERKLARAESLAAIGEMAAALAHEIRNPLAGISGAVQVIADRLSTDTTGREAAREAVQEVARQVGRLNKTVEDLLSFARPRPPELVRSQVNLLVAETLSVLREEPQLEKVEVVTNLSPDLPDVMLDPQQMQNVFMNIILNAGQAMPQGGRLTITTCAEKKDVLISFRDTGVRMSPEVLRHLFRPFFTTKTRGTGVGLSISQKIVEAHGGAIEVESAEGKGSCFTIRLPIPPRKDV